MFFFCVFIFFSFVAGLLMNWVRHKLQLYTMSKENTSACFYGFSFIITIFHFFYSFFVSQHFGICWKHYCIHVKNYFLLSSLSVVCHLKLSYYHFVFISRVTVWLWVSECLSILFLETFDILWAKQITKTLLVQFVFLSFTYFISLLACVIQSYMHAYFLFVRQIQLLFRLLLLLL